MDNETIDKAKMPGRYISLSEVSKLSNVPISTIKRWSSRRVISQPEKIYYGSEGSQGYWPVQVIEEIKAIRTELKSVGRKITLEEAAKRAGEKQGLIKLQKTGGKDIYKKLLERQGEPAGEVLNSLMELFASKKYSSLRKEIVESILEKQVALTFLKIKQEERRREKGK